MISALKFQDSSCQVRLDAACIFSTLKKLNIQAKKNTQSLFVCVFFFACVFDLNKHSLRFNECK